MPSGDLLPGLASYSLINLPRVQRSRYLSCSLSPGPPRYLTQGTHLWG